MAEAERKHAPIRKSVRVNCPIEDAFELFTEGFADWWPLAFYSISGEEAENCALEPWAGGRIFERTRSGEEREWGSVLAWDPPTHVKFTWHPGARADDRQTVDVDFRVDADGTRITLIHGGWHLAGVETSMLHTDYTAQWSAILELYFSEFVSERVQVAV